MRPNPDPLRDFREARDKELRRKERLIWLRMFAWAAVAVWLTLSLIYMLGGI